MIAAVVLGATRITFVKNVLILAGIPATWQCAIVGAFIILAGLVFSFRIDRRSRT